MSFALHAANLPTWPRSGQRQSHREREAQPLSLILLPSLCSAAGRVARRCFKALTVVPYCFNCKQNETELSEDPKTDPWVLVLPSKSPSATEWRRVYEARRAEHHTSTQHTRPASIRRALPHAIEREISRAGVRPPPAPTRPMSNRISAQGTARALPWVVGG
jgi:hypothetical protein